MAGEPAIAASHFAGHAPAQPLVISQEGQRRFMVGLGWGAHNVRDIEIGVPQIRDENGHYDLLYIFKLPYHLFRTVTLSAIRLLMPGLYSRGVTDYEAWKRGISDAGRYDLDLSCYVFGKNMELICVVGPEEGNYHDASKKIYHSGDDQHGSTGGFDDEQAYVETNGLPEHYHHLFFVVETDGRYSLGETPNTHVRLADSRTNKNAIRKPLAPPKEGLWHGVVFCHVFRDGAGWLYRDISEYHGFSADWVRILQGLGRRG
jgi:stress response protein SCP2